MNFYELLYAGKNSGALSATCYELLFAKYLNPGGGDEWAEYDGTLPAQYSANGDNLADYRVYGSAGGVGDKTRNAYETDLDAPKGYYNPDGAFTPNNSYESSKKISCNANDVLTVSAVSTTAAEYVIQIVFLNSEQDFIIIYHRTESGTGEKVHFATAPSNAKYAFVVLMSSFTNKMFVLGSAAPAEYVPYGREVDMSISGNIYNPEATDPNNGYMSGYYMQATGEPAANNSWHITEYISIDPEKKYVVDYAQQGYYTGMAFYDSQKNYLSGQGYMAQKPFTLTVPQNAAYARFSIIEPTYYQSPSIEESETILIFIGSDPLGEGEYVDYWAGKIYRMSGGTLTPTDPPVPLPALPTVDGTTITDYAGQSVAPSRFYAQYKKG